MAEQRGKRQEAELLVKQDVKKEDLVMGTTLCLSHGPSHTSSSARGPCGCFELQIPQGRLRLTKEKLMGDPDIHPSVT